MLNYITPIAQLQKSNQVDALTANYTNALTTHGAYKTQALLDAPSLTNGFIVLKQIAQDLYDNMAEAKQYTSNCSYAVTGDKPGEYESQYFFAFTAPNIPIDKLVRAIADASAQDIWPDKIVYYVGIESILFCIIYSD